MPHLKPHQLVILVIIAGCTTQPGKDHGADKVNAANADIQCRTEQVTGSLVVKKVCTTQAQRDAQQADIGDLKRAVAGQSAIRCGAQGC